MVDGVSEAVCRIASQKANAAATRIRDFGCHSRPGGRPARHFIRQTEKAPPISRLCCTTASLPQRTTPWAVDFHCLPNGSLSFSASAPSRWVPSQQEKNEFRRKRFSYTGRERNHA